MRRIQQLKKAFNLYRQKGYDLDYRWNLFCKIKN